MLTHLVCSGYVLIEVRDGVKSSGSLVGGAADSQPGSVEVPQGSGAEVRGEPGHVQVEGRDGMLDYIAVKAREALRGGHKVPRVVVLIVGQVERILLGSNNTACIKVRGRSGACMRGAKWLLDILIE